MPVLLSASSCHPSQDRKSTRLNSSHTEIYTFPYTTLFRSQTVLIGGLELLGQFGVKALGRLYAGAALGILVPPFPRSEEHTSELQSHRDLHFSLHDALPISNSAHRRPRAPRAVRGQGARPALCRCCSRHPRATLP